MKIEISLESLKKFLDKVESKTTMINGFEKVVPYVEQKFKENFMVKHHETKQITDKAELIKLIKTGHNHKPASPRDAPEYSKKYLERKFSYGEYNPHKFWNYGFWMGTDIEAYWVGFRIKTEQIIQRGFDYLSHHERTRSILKKTMLDSWQGIMDILIKHYADEALES